LVQLRQRPSLGLVGWLNFPCFPGH
jgi:hypothetical protein